MSAKVSKELSKHRLEQAKESLEDAEIFPRNIGHRIVEVSKTREDSDYDDEFVVKPEGTRKQIDTAKELLELVEKYLEDIEKQ